MFHLTRISSNAKAGPMPVSTSSADTCPPLCGMFDLCYGKKGPLLWHWKKVTAGLRGFTWPDFVAAIRKLPRGQLWRHNQAGDLPGKGAFIDPIALDQLVSANKGKRGFTYSHKPVLDNEHATSNAGAIHASNKMGFTINLSADTRSMADRLSTLGIGPVVCVQDVGSGKVTRTPAGRKIVQCPNQWNKNIQCVTCQLCYKADRDYIIGFEEH